MDFRISFVILPWLVIGSLLESAGAADTVELMDGQTLRGTILEIRQQAKEFDFEMPIGSQTIRKTYRYPDVHAVTFKGRRFELTPMPAIKPASSSSDSDGKRSRSKSEVQSIIADVGATPPDWLASTKRMHPATLDLTWPIKAEGRWNESKNVGQYIWGRVNPNESRWRSGIQLIYDCMELHRDEPEKRQRDMEKLGSMYFELFQDYPRAAYWLQKSKATADKGGGVYLAECYWRLGSVPMARAMLRGNDVHFNAIKVLGDMGEIKEALRITQLYAGTNFFNEAFLSAGDALRGAGQTDQAIEYYQRILDINKARNPQYLARFRARATGAIEAIRLYDQADVSRVADGTYKDSSTGYNGKLEVEVTVEDGKITSARVTKHREKQFYAALTDTTGQIIKKQSIQDIDGTSGATITSQAIIHATARALAQGNQPR